MSSPLILSPRSFGPISAATGASAESAQASANPTADSSATAQQSGGGSDPRTGPTPPAASDASDASAVAWLTAWGVLIVLLVLINRTQLGKTITYYVLVLAVLFLVLTQYKFIAATLAPFSQSQQAVTENAGGDQVDPNAVPAGA